VESTEQRRGGFAGEIELGGLFVDDRRLQLVFARHVIDEVGH